MRHTQQKQSGFVAILTVLFFTLLMSVVAIGFLRLMLQEQKQALQDDLSKGAYQAAQAGVEDAKRAILYCNSLTDLTQKGICESNLYRSTCPGFNADPDGPTNPGVSYFTTTIGVPTASLSKGASVGQASADTLQGYSCVIVTRNTPSLNGRLKLNTNSDKTILELRTLTNYTRIQIRWHSIANNGTPFIPPVRTFVNPAASAVAGNPRLPDWPKSGTGQSAPALMRIKTISMDTAPFTLGDIKTSDLFLYPATQSTTGGASSSTPVTLYNMDSGTPRAETRCVADPAEAGYNGYSCVANIEYITNVADKNPVPRKDNRYIVLQTMYRDTEYEITAYNGVGTQVVFDGVQPTIDSTGYQNGVYRRVKVGVRLGGESFVTNAAFDSNWGLCKDFRVGVHVDVWQDNCRL